VFIRNLWYVAAWEHEIPADGLFARTIIDIPLVLFRDDTGRVVALEDRCCHRHAPLSHGRKKGGKLPSLRIPRVEVRRDGTLH
jgi:vanillate O-demethylase monooxygenase subunit